jgi:hypothetical protein
MAVPEGLGWHGARQPTPGRRGLRRHDVTAPLACQLGDSGPTDAGMLRLDEPYAGVVAVKVQPSGGEGR